MARNSFRVELLGAKELIEKFRQMDDAVGQSYIDRALQEGVDYMEGRLVSKARVKTGLMRSAIQSGTLKKEKGHIEKGIAIDETKAPYWRFVERGRHVGLRGVHSTVAAARKAGQKVADARKWIAGKRDLSREWKNRKTTARQVIRDSFRDLMHGFGLQ